ncbi:hypothetical protein M431DRAFT_510026 [Trichoderma harzianum CBS 226.95]|uniref:Uncharacterized protein n=1 Tax=Trichoderma harzianum CBS 226.95 TaxID=983964 RepID=A0A2T4A6Q9_TRIHA|nr:hypothetical protein M431DRAFT_510026 [Trichoderma harzianum CBS 226.95]PTB52750.1 hypothetical protein M431DRAFT_510026 [Trichoderma harzianum CBS 226.95]
MSISSQSPEYLGENQPHIGPPLSAVINHGRGAVTLGEPHKSAPPGASISSHSRFVCSSIQVSRSLAA